MGGFAGKLAVKTAPTGPALAPNAMHNTSLVWEGRGRLVLTAKALSFASGVRLGLTHHLLRIAGREGGTRLAFFCPALESAGY